LSWLKKKSTLHIRKVSNFNSPSKIQKKRKEIMEFKTYMCLICGWVYDEEAGLPDEGIAPGTLWKDVPMNWTCPECGARKEDFEMTVI
jgi:rubredoxin